MIIFGNTQTLLKLPPGSFTNVYNLSSPYEFGIKLYSLIPFSLDINDPNFDFIYANYIMNTEKAFMEMMELVLNVYYGTDAYVLVEEDLNYKYETAESLIKFLQQRYGILVYTVRDLEDLEGLKDTPLTSYGILNLDMDKDRYYESLPENVIEDIARQCYYMENSTIDQKGC